MTSFCLTCNISLFYIRSFECEDLDLTRSHHSFKESLMNIDHAGMGLAGIILLATALGAACLRLVAAGEGL